VKSEASVMIDRPAEEVWKFITDLSNATKWFIPAPLVELRQTSAGPLGVGTTLVESRRVYYKNFTWSDRVIEDMPNHKFSLEIISGPMKGTIGTWSIENIEGKTRLTETVNYKLNGFYKLVKPFIGRKAKVEKESVTHVGNIKRILESEAQS
jgi:uncharacterized membrane protein